MGLEPGGGVVPVPHPLRVVDADHGGLQEIKRERDLCEKSPRIGGRRGEKGKERGSKLGFRRRTTSRTMVSDEERGSREESKEIAGR